MMSHSLPVERILTYLGLAREVPTFDYLRRLILAHRERVPYETATRLLRYRDIADPDARVRLPALVWEESIALGTGGSCSDGSYAFKKLLDALGFEAAMAINSEGEVTRDAEDRVLNFPRERSHCSVIVRVDGQRYVADPCSGHVVKVPLPIGLPYRVDVRGHTEEERAYCYAVEPLGESYYELHNIGLDGIGIEPGDPATGKPPRGQMYIFYDRAVSDDEFEDHLRYGYREGYASTHLSFMCRNRYTKSEYRFSTHSGRLWRSVNGPWEQVALGDDPVMTVAQASNLPYQRLVEALAYLNRIKERSP